jgi:potassium-transporting ATPase KdpC subunit
MQISRALRAVAILTLLTGVIYPVVVLLGAQAVFPRQADGSLIERDGNIVGSELIGQLWLGEEWFYGRPSATDFDGAASGGTNHGPLSADLTAAILERAEAISEIEGPYRDVEVSDIPVDLLTSSASGLDPHISVAAALFQVARVAEVRGVPADAVVGLIDDFTQAKTLGVWGQERVNVLELNLALDRLVRT